MLALLCAVAIGQIEDVAQLRERYEKAQAVYEMLQKGHAQMQATYDPMDDLISRQEEARHEAISEALFSRIGTTPAPSMNTKLQAMYERHQEQWARHKKLHEEHRRTISRLLRESEIRLRQYKRHVELLKWQYEQAAGWPSAHWA